MTLPLLTLVALLVSPVRADIERSGRIHGDARRPVELKACGVKGSVSSRIKDCDDRKQATQIIEPALWADYGGDPLGGLDEPKRTWKLVSDQAGTKIWLDQSTGMLWGGTIETGGLPENPYADPCEDVKLRGSLDIEFHVPTQAEFQAAQLNGLRAFIEDPWDRAFHVADLKDRYFDGRSSEFIDEATAIEKKRRFALVCTAVGAKPRPPVVKRVPSTVDIDYVPPKRAKR